MMDLLCLEVMGHCPDRQALFKHVNLRYYLCRQVYIYVFVYWCSTTEEDVQTTSNGFLGWWTPLTPLC